MIRRRRPRAALGSATIEYLIVLAVVGVGVSGALLKAGVDLHEEFGKDRRAIASPFP